MPANVETMMYAGMAPWHGIGVPVGTEVTSAEAIRRAGLDWEVATVALRACCPGDPAIPGHRAVVRQSDQKPLAVVGDRYTPIQNRDSFAFMDALVGSGEAAYHTAGSLDGGRRVWLLCKLPGEIRVRSIDLTEKYLLLSNSHDGTSALRVLLTPVRVVCSNTLNLALWSGAEHGIAVRHTPSAPRRIEEARRILELARQYYGTFGDHIAFLASQRYTDQQMVALARDLLPGHADDPSARTLRAREKVVELFSEGRGHEVIRGTAWAALNAVAEWTDHLRPSRATSTRGWAEGQLASAWFGSGASLKRSAHALILRQLAA